MFACIGVINRCGDVQEFARKCEAGLSGRAGEKAVVPDPVEAARQDMAQEAADELIECERHEPQLPIWTNSHGYFVMNRPPSMTSIKSW